MKKTETFIVFRNKKTGDFLSKYKSKEQTLAYSAEYTERLKRAAKNEVEAIEDFTKLANALNCELLEVTATYELKTLDGEEPEDLTDKTENSKSESLKKFLAMLANGLEDD